MEQPCGCGQGNSSAVKWNNHVDVAKVIVVRSSGTTMWMSEVIVVIMQEAVK